MQKNVKTFKCYQYSILGFIIGATCLILSSQNRRRFVTLPEIVSKLMLLFIVL